MDEVHEPEQRRERSGGISALLQHPRLYLLLQAPWARQKLDPLLARDELGKASTVLDLGCGPGTNARFFAGTAYLGLDINPRYITYARRRHPDLTFEVADVITWEPPRGRAFDLVLANSFFHHLDDESADRILTRMAQVVSAGGTVHILDLVLPEKRSISRTLALHDRGLHARSAGTWRSMFRRHFSEERFEQYTLTTLGIPLWQMVHFKGSRLTTA